MKNQTKTLFNKVASLALAAVMALSVMFVTAPTEVAAAEPSFTSTGKSSVTITDEQCYNTTGALTYIKFTAKQDGYLKITAKNASNTYSYTAGEWQLYDKKKKTAVSPVMEYTTNSTDALYYSDYYGVKKGTTYYLGVAAYAGTKLDASFTKISDKSGSKKTKALNIKNKKTATGLIRVGDKNSDWYKFKLTSAKKLNVIFTPYTNDLVYVTLSGPGVYTKTFKVGSASQGKKNPFTTTGKVKAGTYYIQVKPATKTCSGHYTLTWK